MVSGFIEVEVLRLKKMKAKDGLRYCTTGTALAGY